MEPHYNWAVNIFFSLNIHAVKSQAKSHRAILSPCKLSGDTQFPGQHYDDWFFSSFFSMVIETYHVPTVNLCSNFPFWDGIIQKQVLLSISWYMQSVKAISTPTGCDIAIFLGEKNYLTNLKGSSNTLGLWPLHFRNSDLWLGMWKGNNVAFAIQWPH